VNEKEQKNGICPFISTSAVVPSEVDGGVIDIKGKSARVVNLTNTPLLVFCQGEKCQLWDSNMNRCAMVTTPAIDYGLERLAGTAAPSVSLYSLIQTLSYSLTDISNAIGKIADRG
jgi:hypothetical protein